MKTKEKVNSRNFTKATLSGISLITLIITIIVIVILAAAVILTLSNNNPVDEANRARYESDVDSMQATFTNTIAKIMAQNRAVVSVTEGQINTTTKDVKETTGQVSYTVTNAMNSNNNSGTIIFDNGPNTETTYYTGKKLPIYAAGETKWYVDSEGNITVEVAGKSYGNGTITNANVWNGSWDGDTSKASESIAVDAANGLYLYKISDTVFTKEDLIGKTAYLITTEGVTQEMVLTSDKVILTGPTGTEVIAVEGFEQFLMFVIENTDLGNGFVLTTGVWAMGDSSVLQSEGIAEFGIRGLSGSGVSIPIKQYGTVTIEDIVYPINNEEISVNPYNDGFIETTFTVYKVTDECYTLDGFREKYFKVYVDNEFKYIGKLDGTDKDRSLIVEENGYFQLYDSLTFLPLVFIEEGREILLSEVCNANSEGFAEDIKLTEGIYMIDMIGAFDYLQMTAIDYVIEKDENNHILLDIYGYSEQIDIDLSEETTTYCYRLSEQYFEKETILNSIIIAETGDFSNISSYITEDKIKQVNENVYIVDAYNDYIFASEDTYVDSDGDGTNDTFYPKGVSAYTIYNNYYWNYTKIIKE